jgi:outer membrane receptor for monomeric catechols
VTKADTQRVPLGISFFHPSGFGASWTTTYYNQDGKFGGLFTGNPIRHGNDNFWVVDAAIGYRLPQRYGFFTVGVTNLFDKNFKYFDPDINNASIRPSRTVFTKLTLALP